MTQTDLPSITDLTQWLWFLMNFRLKTNSVHKISTRKNCKSPTLSL